MNHPADSSLPPRPGAGVPAAPASCMPEAASGPVSPDCPLCQAQHETVLWQDARLRIIHVPHEPGLPAYFRVIWQHHVPEMTDLEEGDRHHLWQVLTQVEQGMRLHFQPAKINLAAFGNLVPHLHWHLIGRWPSDPQFPGSAWSPVVRPDGSPEQQAVAARVAERLPAFRQWLVQQLAA